MRKVTNWTLRELQPSQFYISAKKLQDVETWLDARDLSGFPPIPVKLLDGRPVMTDGHTRAVAALRAGLETVPLVWDEDELDWEMYRICVAACRDRRVFSPADLMGRIVTESEYREKWDGWCDVMHAEVRERRLSVKGTKGGDPLEITAFDTEKLDTYAAQAKAQWGGTEAYREYEKKSEGRTQAQEQALAAGMMEIFAAFGEAKHLSPSSAEAQRLVRRLQDYITENYYSCTKQILAGLGQAYAAGGEFTENIDRAGGPGTAQFTAEAIRVYCAT